MSDLSQAFEDWCAGRISDQQLEDAEQAARGPDQPSDYDRFNGMSEQEIILVLIGDRLQDHEPPF
jgi:hypothetical protein